MAGKQGPEWGPSPAILTQLRLVAIVLSRVRNIRGPIINFCGLGMDGLDRLGGVLHAK